MSNCCICLLDINKSNITVKTPCDHIFHFNCFIDFIFHSKTFNKCPICRENINTNIIKNKIITHSNYCINCLKVYKNCSNCNSKFCDCYITNDDCIDCKLKYEMNKLKNNISFLDNYLNLNQVA